MSDAKPPGSSTVEIRLQDAPGGYVGPYRLVGTLGEGGFGIVYEAEQSAPVRRRVALKVIKLGMDTREVVARFEGERQALASMDHPHIAKVFGAGATDDGRPYFAMELVKGEPINRFCDGHQLDIHERLHLFVQVCEAVQHAHGSGIIHRDLKPANILVSSQDARPFAKVIDFGIAKAVSGRLGHHSVHTQQGLAIGTPMYMSPEQVDGIADIDPRTDIYSLGVVLYELLAGTTPFAADTMNSLRPLELQRLIREVDPPTPSSRLARSPDTLDGMASRCRMEPRALTRLLRGELDWVVMKALEKNRARRYGSVADLAADLRRFLAGEPVRAAPPSAAYRLRKQLSRHRALAAAGALILVLLGGLAWQAWRPPSAPPVIAATEKSIAVLPFANLGGSEEDARFALGLHDEVLGNLAGIADLRVISRSSVMAYQGSGKTVPQIAAELDVAMVLDGTVSRDGDRVRIQLSLNDAARNALVWSQRFDTELTADKLAQVQTRITREIAAHLGARVSEAEGREISAVGTRNTEAYSAYLQGMALARYGESTEKERNAALLAFDAALAADPDYVAALAAKAVTHMSLFWAGVDKDANIHAARLAVDRATKLAPDSADSLIALAYYHYWGFFDYARAEEALARAVAVQPNNADAWAVRASVARRDLRFADAVAAYERCVELDPLRPGNYADLAYAIALAGDMKRAQEVAAHAKAQAPKAPYVIGSGIQVAILAGDFERAWRLARDLPVLDSGAYDYVRTTLGLYSRDPARLQALLATWPAPRPSPPQFNYIDLVRIFALRAMGADAQAATQLAVLKQRVQAELAANPGDDENRKLIIAIHGLAGDRDRLLAAYAAMMAEPPRDKLWLVEEGFVVVLGMAAGGEKEIALDLAAQVMDTAGAAQFERIAASPVFDDLRSEPRYLELQARYRAWKSQNQ